MACQPSSASSRTNSSWIALTATLWVLSAGLSPAQAGWGVTPDPAPEIKVDDSAQPIPLPDGPEHWVWRPNAPQWVVVGGTGQFRDIHDVTTGKRLCRIDLEKSTRSSPAEVYLDPRGVYALHHISASRFDAYFLRTGRRVGEIRLRNIAGKARLAGMNLGQKLVFIAPTGDDRLGYQLYNAGNGRAAGQRITQFTWDGDGAIAFSPGSKYLAVLADATGKLFVMDPLRGVPVGEADGVAGRDHQYVSMAFSSDGKKLAALDLKGPHVTVFDWSTGNVAADVALDERAWQAGTGRGADASVNLPVPAICWLADGSGWVIQGSRVVDAKTGKLRVLAGSGVQGVLLCKGLAISRPGRNALALAVGKPWWAGVPQTPNDADEPVQVAHRDNPKSTPDTTPRDPDGSGKTTPADPPVRRPDTSLEPIRVGNKSVLIQSAGRLSKIDTKGVKYLDEGRGLWVSEPVDWAVKPDPAPSLPDKPRPVSIPYGTTGGSSSLWFVSGDDAPMLVVSSRRNPPSFNVHAEAIDRFVLSTGAHAGTAFLPRDFEILDVSPAATRAVTYKRETEGGRAFGKDLAHRIDVWDISAEGKHLFGWDNRLPEFVPPNHGANRNKPRYSRYSQAKPTLAYFPDDEHLVTCFKNRLVLWDVKARKPLLCREIPNVSRFTLTPGGRYLVAAGSKDVHFLDARTLARAGSIITVDTSFGGGNLTPSFSADGKVMLTAQHINGGSVLARWDVATGQKIDACTVPAMGDPTLIGENTALLGGWQHQGTGYLVNLDRKAIAWKYMVRNYHGASSLRRYPGGVLWIAGTTRAAQGRDKRLVPWRLPDPKAADAFASAKPIQPVLGWGSKVRLELSYSPPSRQKVTSRADALKRLADSLSRRGVTVDDSAKAEFRMSVSVRSGDSIKMIESKDRFGLGIPGVGGKEVTVRKKVVHCRREFVGADGKVQWSSEYKLEQPGGSFSLREGESISRKVEEMAWSSAAGLACDTGLPAVIFPADALKDITESLMTDEGAQPMPQAHRKRRR